MAGEIAALKTELNDAAFEKDSSLEKERSAKRA